MLDAPSWWLNLTGFFLLRIWSSKPVVIMYSGVCMPASLYPRPIWQARSAECMGANEPAVPCCASSFDNVQCGLAPMSAEESCSATSGCWKFPQNQKSSKRSLRFRCFLVVRKLQLLLRLLRLGAKYLVEFPCREVMYRVHLRNILMMFLQLLTALIVSAGSL